MKISNCIVIWREPSKLTGLDSTKVSSCSVNQPLLVG